MILTCHECGTRYNAKDEAFLPAGRRVRCAKCGHAWHQAPPEAEAEAAPAPEPVAETPAAPAPQPHSYAPAPSVEPQPAVVKPNRALGRLAAAGGWLGLVAVVLVIGWSAVSYRQSVATIWPRSATLYAALGMPVNMRGLIFEGVAYHRESEDRQTVLAVSGRLINVSGRAQQVPPIRGVLTAADGHELYRWQFAAGKAMLGAGESLNFLTRLSSPPAAARHLELTFAGSSE